MAFFEDSNADHTHPTNMDPPETPRPYVPFQAPHLPQKDFSDKARMRLFKIQLLEQEQKLREAEELRMTDEQRETLFTSFQSVKFEYTDLDGLSWTAPEASRLLQQWHQTRRFVPHSESNLQVLRTSSTPNSPVLARWADGFGSNEDTIRAYKMDDRRPNASSPLLPASSVSQQQENKVTPPSDDSRTASIPPVRVSHIPSRTVSMPIVAELSQAMRTNVTRYAVGSKIPRASECGAIRNRSILHASLGLSQRTSLGGEM